MLTLSPDPMPLLQKALLERGEAMAILADPAAGEDATIVSPIQLPLHLPVEGRERWLQFRLTFDEDSVGNVAHALVLGRDITKLERQETQSEALGASFIVAVH